MDYELQQELARIRTILKRSKATFVTVAGVENLIEVSTSDAKKVGTMCFSREACVNRF